MSGKVFGKNELTKLLGALNSHPEKQVSKDSNWFTIGGLLFSKESVIISQELIDLISSKGYVAIAIDITNIPFGKKGMLTVGKKQVKTKIDW